MAKSQLGNLVRSELRKGAGLEAMLSPQADEEAPPEEAPKAAKVEREPISTRLPKGFKKRMMLLAVNQERDVQELYEEAVRAYLEMHEAGGQGD
jgi:hypothetical protein